MPQPVSRDVMYVFMNMGWIMILAIMSSNTRASQKYSSLTLDQKLFTGILWAAMLTMAFDAGMWISDGRTYRYAWIVNGISTNLYYMGQLLVTLLWVLYVDYYTQRDRILFMKRLPLYVVPILFGWFLVIISPITGWVYYIDYYNVYHRGPYMFICLIVSWIGILYSFILTYLRMRHIENASERNHYLWIYMFPILPIIGIVIQVKYYGLATMWPCCCISLFMVFINNQSRQTNYDDLTGVHNRRYLDRFLRWKSETLKSNRALIITMIDMDGFKAINDQYGHVEGDNALTNMATLINKILQKTDIAARYGGDEFIIVTEAPKDADTMDAARQLDQVIDEYNAHSNKPYALDFSAGTIKYTKDSTESMEEIIGRADELMYKRKLEKKQLNQIKRK